MSLFCLASAHGSPGVTTTVLAMAAVWPDARRLVVIEADQSGGVLAARFGLHDAPGLVDLAGVGTRSLDLDAVLSYCQALPGGLPCLLGPASPEAAGAALADLVDSLAAWATTAEVDVIVDCGRTRPDDVTTALMQAADQTWVVVRPTLEQLRPSVGLVAALGRYGVSAPLLLVGDRPYGHLDVSRHFGVEVSGVIAHEPAAAEALTTGGSNRALSRSRLVRSAGSLVDTLSLAATESENRSEVMTR